MAKPSAFASTVARTMTLVALVYVAIGLLAVVVFAHSPLGLQQLIILNLPYGDGACMRACVRARAHPQGASKQSISVGMSRRTPPCTRALDRV